MTKKRQIEERPLAQIIPYARNPRKNEQAVSTVAASIKEFGPAQPITVDKEGVIITGHTRLLAAQALGMATFPVIVLDHLTPQQVKAYRIMDNRSNQNATWEYEMLRGEFLDLQGNGVDLSLTGFEDYEIEPLLATEWTPPEAGKGEDGDEHPTSGAIVKCTQEQYEVFQRAVKKVRAVSGDETISEGRCLELVAGDYLAG